jgi:hypothetical protein
MYGSRRHRKHDGRRGAGSRRRRLDGRQSLTPPPLTARAVCECSVSPLGHFPVGFSPPPGAAAAPRRSTRHHRAGCTGIGNHPPARAGVRPATVTRSGGGCRRAAAAADRDCRPGNRPDGPGNAERRTPCSRANPLLEPEKEDVAVAAHYPHTPWPNCLRHRAESAGARTSGRQRGGPATRHLGADRLLAGLLALAGDSTLRI